MTASYLKSLAPQGMISTGMCEECCCDDLKEATGGTGPYSTPVNDGAPWYDPAYPESARFAGLFLTKITGLGPGRFSRQVAARAGSGSTLGASRQEGPVIVVTGLLIGECDAAEYGLTWLRSVLRGACPDNACDGATLTYLTSTPCADQDCTGQSTEKLWAPYFRTLRGMALIDGPSVTNLIPRACSDCCDCPLMEVTFTLAGSSPCAYADTAPLFGPLTFSQHAVPYECDITFKADCTDNVDPDCPPDPDCAADPLCVAATTAPTLPIPVSICANGCEPLTGQRITQTIASGTMTSIDEAVLTMTVSAGASALRNLRVRVIANPGNAAASTLKDCDACGDFSLAYLPAGAVFTLDGAARTKKILCKTGVTSDAALSSVSGHRFLWPDIGCPDTPYTIIVTASNPVDPSAYISLGYTPREC